LDLVGAPARARVLLILACVLGLSGADTATISATTGNLERAFGIGNTQVGLLVSVTALAGALGTIPVGVLTDRTRRTWLLAGSIACWATVTVLSALSVSYLWLMLILL
jgi:predicted MFS family arabinose efflux permease